MQKFTDFFAESHYKSVIAAKEDWTEAETAAEVFMTYWGNDYDKKKHGLKNFDYWNAKQGTDAYK